MRAVLTGLLLLGVLALSSSASGQKAQVVAVLPFTVHSAEDLTYLRTGLAEMLTSRLGQVPEIVVIDRSLVQSLLGSRTDVTDEMARRIGSALRADYVVIGSLIKAGEALSLQVKAVPVQGGDSIMVFEQGRGLDAVVEKMSPLAQGLARRLRGEGRAVVQAPRPPGGVPGLVPPPPGAPEGSRAGETRPLWRSRTFSGEIRGIAVGDLAGDGGQSVVLLEQQAVRVVQVTDKGLTSVASFRGTVMDDFVAVDVADTNRNGRAEIIVTNFVAQAPRSFVLELQGRSLTRIARDIPYHLRAVRMPGQGVVLLGQSAGLDQFYSGTPFALSWQGRELIRGSDVGVPPFIPVYSVAYGRVTGEAGTQLVALGDTGQLMLSADGGQATWSGHEAYDGSAIFVETSPAKELGDSREIHRIPGRVVVTDDGLVLVRRNTFSFLARYIGDFSRPKSGQVVGLRWGDVGLDEVWQTPEFSGYVADFAVASGPRGEPLLFVVEVRESGFLLTRTQSVLHIFQLPASGR